MVRDKNGIIAEANDPDTLLVDENILLKVDKLVVTKANKKAGILYDPLEVAQDKKQLFYYDADNNIVLLPVESSKVLGIDAAGNLAFIDPTSIISEQNENII